MKKFLLSLCLLLAVTLTAEAQMRPTRRHRHVQKQTMAQPMRYRDPSPLYSPVGELRFHVIGDMGVRDFGAIFRHEIPYHFSVGGMAEYQLGHATNIGLGVEFYSAYGEHTPLFRNMQETYIHTVPVYANLKFTVPHIPVSPFIEGRVGFSIPAGSVTCLDPDGEHHYMSTGLYTGGAVGIKIYRAYLSWGVSVIDVVDKDLGFNGGRLDVITDYYFRLSFAF